MITKIYKYVPFSEGSLCILNNGTIKYSHSNEFNDPFDCVVDYNIEETIKNISEREDLFERAAEQLGTGLDVIEEKKKIMLASLEESLTNKTPYDSVMDKIGICCFSLKPDNILMWSHYAENHKGFLVEFTTDQSNPDIVESTEKYLGGYLVEYSDKMPVRSLGLSECESSQEDLYKQFLTKSAVWFYESEFRVLSLNKGPGIHQFCQNMVSAVIAGAKMGDAHIQILSDTVNNLSSKLQKNIGFSKAEMIKGKYALKLNLSK